MHRMLLLLLILLLPVLAWGEAEPEGESPLTLRHASSMEEVKEFLLLPTEDALAEVRQGFIRYISQNEERDAAFRDAYWLGGKKGSILDLTITERQGKELPFHAGNMCSRAAYSMALSYLGIDMTPGGMSALMHTRNLNSPYDDVSAQLGVERVSADANVFNTMFQNYQDDTSYSPVYLYFRRPNGTTHAVLVVARNPDNGRFLVVDSNALRSAGKLHRTYYISLNKARNTIINSTFKMQLEGSKVLQLFQWRLTEPAEDTLPDDSATVTP